MVITAPSADAPMFVMGVNESSYDPKVHTIVRYDLMVVPTLCWMGNIAVLVVLPMYCPK